MKVNILQSLFKKDKPVKLSTPQVLVFGFIIMILVGTILLMLPIMTSPGKHTGFLTAFFTATSAVCVTGLVVVDTGTHWSLAGQVLILLLIQIGGIGFMTMAIIIFMVMGKKIGLKNRLLVQESLNQLSLQGVIHLTKMILLFTLITESVSAIMLAIRWTGEMGVLKAVWFGIFHSVAAFNNAGFDLFGNYRSLTQFASDPVVNFAIIVPVIIGGLGYSVVYEIWAKKGRVKKFSLHTRLVINITIVLLVLGILMFAVIEWNYSLQGLTFKEKLLVSVFQGTTQRTAGFNTVDITGLHASTLFSFIIFMFIGASPGSTGGGVKTTTVSLLLLASVAISKGHSDIQLYNRRIPFDQVYKSLAIFMMSVFWVVIVTMILTVTENADFLKIIFEAVSAFGTAGLSIGQTGRLSQIGQLLIALTMFLGKMGPLTVAIALAEKKKRANIKYSEERIIVG